MVVFIADENVVDHALEKLGVVCADDAGVAVGADCQREVAVGLRWRLGLVAAHQREAADEPLPVLCFARARLCRQQLVLGVQSFAWLSPVAVKAADEHDFAVAYRAYCYWRHG